MPLTAACAFRADPFGHVVVLLAGEGAAKVAALQWADVPAYGADAYVIHGLLYNYLPQLNITRKASARQKFRSAGLPCRDGRMAMR